MYKYLCIYMYVCVYTHFKDENFPCLYIYIYLYTLEYKHYIMNGGINYGV